MSPSRPSRAFSSSSIASPSASLFLASVGSICTSTSPFFTRLAPIDAHLGRDAAGVAGHRGSLVGHQRTGQLQHVATGNDFQRHGGDASAAAVRRCAALVRQGCEPERGLAVGLSRLAACGFAPHRLNLRDDLRIPVPNCRSRRRQRARSPPATIGRAVPALDAGQGDYAGRRIQALHSESLNPRSLWIVRPMRRS